jgi:DNA-binding transcriptional ArsR family regulator
MHKVIHKMNIRVLPEEAAQLHAEMCSALSDPRRILLLYALAERPHKVNDLAGEIGISQPATSRHLKTLRDRGLVLANRQGTNIEYSLSDPRLIQALDLLRAVLNDRIRYRANLLSLDNEDEAAY